MKRETLKKHWWEPVLLLVLAFACFFWWRASQNGRAGDYAEVTYDGKPVLEIPLGRDGIYTLSEDPAVRFEVRGGAVAFVDATCPDKICEREGFLSRDGQTAVCLPRKTRLVVYAKGQGESGPDVIAR